GERGRQRGHRAAAARLPGLGAAPAAAQARPGRAPAPGGRPGHARERGRLMAGGASSWSFEERDFHRIERLLQGLLYDSHARCALLVDRTGQLVTTAGEKPDFGSVAFSSLAAADFSANDQLA